ncbi:glycosyltransferase [Priestia sp. OVL9]|nr:glycosyltransferase [Priestia sp. OVL9]
MIKIDFHGHYYNSQNGKYYKKGKYYRKKGENNQNKLRETKSEINQVHNLDNSLYKMSIKNNHNHPIKVSIIMPTYNKYNQISLSLYGLSKQTFPDSDYEVILVDDASSDKTRDILKEIDVPFKFKYIRMKKIKDVPLYAI